MNNSTYNYCIDFPIDRINQEKCEVIGWIFHKEGYPIKKIRLKIKNKIFDGVIGYPRPDVTSYFNNAKESEHSGFRVPVELNAGLNKMMIEILSREKDCWEIAGIIEIKYTQWSGFNFFKKGFIKKFQETRVCKKPPWRNYLKRLFSKKNFLINSQSRSRFIAIIRNDLLTNIHYFLDRKKLIGLGYLVQHAPKAITHEKYPKHQKLDCYPKITIVTPSYNQGNFLEATIQSVLNQNYSNLEYIVIDGGSQDASSQIIKKHESYLSYAVSEQDQGQSHAIQKGFDQCTGGCNDIMAYLNSDDTYLPGALEFVANYFHQHPEVDMIYGHRVLIDEHGNEIGRWFTPHHNHYNLSVLDYVPQETMFWRKRFYDKIGGIDPGFHFAMDWDLLLRIQESGAVIKRVPYFLACFRVHTQQKTNIQMSTIGEIEINKLRERSHNGKVSQKNIAKVHKKNSIESAITSLLFGRG